MHGKHPEVKAKIIDLEHTSCGHGGAIPDPQLMTKTRLRTTTFSNDLNRMTRTQFDYRGEWINEWKNQQIFHF